MESIYQIEKQLKTAKQLRIQGIAEHLRVPVHGIILVKDYCISITCDSIAQLANPLILLPPEKDKVFLKYMDGITLNTPYRIMIKNEFYDRYLRIEFISGSVKYWLKLDFKNMPAEFVEKHFIKGERGIYRIEEHRFDSRTSRQFVKSFRIPRYDFKHKSVLWMYGQVDSTSEQQIHDIIKDIAPLINPKYFEVNEEDKS